MQKFKGLPKSMWLVVFFLKVKAIVQLLLYQSLSFLTIVWPVYQGNWNFVVLEVPVLVFYCYYNILQQLCGLKHKFTILQFWRSEVWCGSHWAKTKVSVEAHAFWDTVGRVLPFSTFIDHPHSLPQIPFLHLQSQQQQVESSEVTSFWSCHHISPLNPRHRLPLSLTHTHTIAGKPSPQRTIDYTGTT